MSRDAGLGERELLLLRWLVRRGPSTVGEATEHFGTEHGLARTTVQTMLERLRQKGKLRRRKVDGVYRYATSESASELLRGVVRSFVDGPLGGSLSPFVAYLAESDDLSEDDLAELERVVERLQSRREEEP